MPLPPFDSSSGNLPPGIHEATWDELTAAFGSTPQRRQLLDGLLRALRSLRRAGCRLAYVNGSFVTAKQTPGDFDGCWDAQGVDPDALDPVLLDFTNRRAAQKAKFGGSSSLLLPALIERERGSRTSFSATKRPAILKASSRSISEVFHDHQ
jgi:hypothetical protein